MKTPSFLEKVGVTPRQILYLMLANLFYALALDCF